VAARLRRSGQSDVAVIDPATTHYYQYGHWWAGAALRWRKAPGCSPRSCQPG
jgi:hypothetical protein